MRVCVCFLLPVSTALTLALRCKCHPLAQSNNSRSQSCRWNRTRACPFRGCEEATFKRSRSTLNFPEQALASSCHNVHNTLQSPEMRVHVAGDTRPQVHMKWPQPEAIAAVNNSVGGSIEGWWAEASQLWARDMHLCTFLGCYIMTMQQVRRKKGFLFPNPILASSWVE